MFPIIGQLAQLAMQLKVLLADSPPLGPWAWKPAPGGPKLLL